MKLTTIAQQIREALSSLNQDDILCDIPDAEFVTGGSITTACRAAGYDESGRVTVNNLKAWNMTVAKFAEHITPAEEIPNLTATDHHFSTGQYDQFQQRIQRMPNGTTMGATSYHGKPAIWTTGMKITHVTDDGQLYPGTVKSIADGLLEIEYPDGESGWEQPATCYPG